MYKTITVNTKLIALLGTPLGFTKAPAMFNGTFDATGLDYFYYPVETTAESLPDILTGVRRMNYAGLVVTKPLKIEMVKHLDGIDPLAQKTGSVNTVVIRDGDFIGYNTDGMGFTRAFVESFGNDAEGKRFFVIGAGGASRAVCFSLAENCGAEHIAVTDVNQDAGKSLCRDLSEKTGTKSEFIESGSSLAEKHVSDCDVVINASGIGMEPHLDETPIDPAWISDRQIVCDLAYNPPKTRLLKDAEAKGCRVMNGVGMVIMQGVMQFSLWTGLPEPVETMRGIIEKTLNLTKE